jgi:hypothetical protein
MVPPIGFAPMRPYGLMVAFVLLKDRVVPVVLRHVDWNAANLRGMDAQSGGMGEYVACHVSPARTRASWIRMRTPAGLTANMTGSWSLRWSVRHGARIHWWAP